jgi:poly(3-hydroxybutyrate) depolymerase
VTAGFAGLGKGPRAVAFVGALAVSFCRSNRKATPPDAAGPPEASTQQIASGSSDRGALSGASGPEADAKGAAARGEGTDLAKRNGSADPRTGSGCGRASPQTGTFHLQTVDGNGSSREYEVLIPSTYRPLVPLALTFAYHGSDATEAAAESFGLQNAPGAAAASIFVFPRGAPYRSTGVGWDDSCDGYDMVFFDNMLDHLEREYCVDESRVFAAGFSWGCDHVTALMCCRGNRIRAVAAASCSDEFSNTSSYTNYKNLPCPAFAPAGIRFTHDAQGDTSYSQREFTRTSELYRWFNSCSSSSVATLPFPCVSYQDCSKPYIECAYAHLGHALPSTWPADTWSFFSTFK